MLVLGVVVAAMLGAVACGSSGKTTVGSSSDAYGNGDTAAPTTTPATGNVGATGDFVADKNKTYDATIETNMGTIKIRLDSAHAPVASGRFIELRARRLLQRSDVPPRGPELRDPGRRSER